jgi:hypothetical protein
MGSGEWGQKSYFTTPLPIPYSPFPYFLIVSWFLTLLTPEA